MQAISSFTNAMPVGGERPQNADNQVLVMKDRRISLVPADTLNGDLRAQMEDARKEFEATLRGKFGDAVVDSLQKNLHEGNFCLRNVTSLVNRASMTNNVYLLLVSQPYSQMVLGGLGDFGFADYYLQDVMKQMPGQPVPAPNGPQELVTEEVREIPRDEHDVMKRI